MSAVTAMPDAGSSEQRAAEAVGAHALGFWIFLMSDAIIFALLFATYATMSQGAADAPSTRELFDLRRTFAETVLLLTSSLTCGFSALGLQQGKARSAVIWLVVTLLLGLGFIVVEAGEFRDMIGRGAGPDRSGFLSSFYGLVGTHGLHVSLGTIWGLVMIAQLQIKGLTPMVRSRLERWGQFWHFLDIVWIGIFSLVYLPGLVA